MLFQPGLRRALERLGRGHVILLSQSDTERVNHVIEKVRSSRLAPTGKGVASGP